MRGLVTAWFWALLGVTFPIGWALGLGLLVVTAPVDPLRHAVHRFWCAWCHAYLRAWPLWSVRVLGRDRLPPGPCVLVANHQSAVDILALMGLGANFKFVSKAELFRVPLLGTAMRLARYVSLDRALLRSPERLFEACAVLLRAGEPVLIFPEGTYASGERRLPFKRGAFRLAQLERVPLVPVVVRGAGELMFEDGPTLAPRATLTVEVMPALTPPTAQDDLDAWVLDVERRFAQWLGQAFPHHLPEDEDEDEGDPR